METSIGEEDGVNANGQGLATINENRALLSVLAAHLQTQQKSRIRGQQLRQQQQQQQQLKQKGDPEGKLAIATVTLLGLLLLLCS